MSPSQSLSLPRQSVFWEWRKKVVNGKIVHYKPQKILLFSGYDDGKNNFSDIDDLFKLGFSDEC